MDCLAAYFDYLLPFGVINDDDDDDDIFFVLLLAGSPYSSRQYLDDLFDVFAFISSGKHLDEALA